MAEKTVYQQLAAGIGQGDSKIVPDIFKKLADEKEAALVLAASPPRTVAQLAEETGFEESEIARMIDPLFKKGLMFKSKKSDATRYYRVRSFLQFHDATAVMNDPPEGVMDLWKEWTAGEWIDASRTMDEHMPSPAMRVIPVNVAIDYNSQVLAMDDIAQQIEQAETIAVTRCSCRVIDGACDLPLWNCVQLNKAADYALERGTGKPLTKEEAMELMRDCEEEGLVHTVGAGRTPGHVICNCCSDCCINWTSLRHGKNKFINPSRFRATIEEDECTGCELCIERCYFDAMNMSDDGKLATVDAEKCLGCGLCQVVCAPAAIAMDEARPQEYIGR